MDTLQGKVNATDLAGAYCWWPSCKYLVAVECVPQGLDKCAYDSRGSIGRSNSGGSGNFGVNNIGSLNFGSGNRGNNNWGNANYGSLNIGNGFHGTEKHLRTASDIKSGSTLFFYGGSSMADSIKTTRLLLKGSEDEEVFSSSPAFLDATIVALSHDLAHVRVRSAPKDVNNKVVVRVPTVEDVVGTATITLSSQGMGAANISLPAGAVLEEATIELEGSSDSAVPLHTSEYPALYFDSEPDAAACTVSRRAGEDQLVLNARLLGEFDAGELVTYAVNVVDADSKSLSTDILQRPASGEMEDELRDWVIKTSSATARGTVTLVASTKEHSVFASTQCLY